MARPAADTTYYSDPFEVGEARSLAYWFQTLGSYPATVTNPATAHVETAKLNLSYTRISSPVTGLSSFARVQDGAYVNAENSLLTYVEKVDPIWVNFSISENEMLAARNEQKAVRVSTTGLLIREAKNEPKK